MQLAYPFTLVQFTDTAPVILPPEAFQLWSEISPFASSEKGTQRRRRRISARYPNLDSSVNGACVSAYKICLKTCFYCLLWLPKSSMLRRETNNLHHEVTIYFNTINCHSDNIKQGWKYPELFFKWCHVNSLYFHRHKLNCVLIATGDVVQLVSKAFWKWNKTQRSFFGATTELSAHLWMSWIVSRTTGSILGWN